jgi:hypothetical protein
MTDDNNDAIKIDEHILTYTVSDEALEAAAAGTERGAFTMRRTGLSQTDWRLEYDTRCC